MQLLLVRSTEFALATGNAEFNQIEMLRRQLFGNLVPEKPFKNEDEDETISVKEHEIVETVESAESFIDELAEIHGTQS